MTLVLNSSNDMQPDWSIAVCVALHSALTAACPIQVQAVQLSLSEEQSKHAETAQQLASYQKMLAAADAKQRHLKAQPTDLQTQQADSQAALRAEQDKLTASEAALAEAAEDTKQLWHQVQLSQQTCRTPVCCQLCRNTAAATCRSCSACFWACHSM